MNTCKDCIYYVVCGQYDMYGDCAEKCFDFFKKAPFGKTGSCKDSKHRRMGIRALEAQLPKKPKHTYISYTGVRSGICQCGKHLEEFDNFCSNCGQAIDWWNWSEKE